MERKNIQDQYKWNLSTMFNTNDDWYKEYDELNKLLPKTMKYKGKVLESAKTLLELINFDMEISKRIEKLYVYANMHLDEDTNNAYYQEMAGKIDNLNSQFSLATSYITPEILSCDFKLIKKYIDEEKGLEEYKYYLEEIFRFKKYVLSKEEERLIASFDQVMENPSKVSSLLRNSDLKFDKIKNEKNELVELNNSNYSLYMMSKDRNVRKDAFTSLYKGYAEHKNTLAKTLSGDLEASATIVKIRGYNSVREASLFANNINESIYDNLVDTINKNMNSVYKYYDLRKKVLGLNELHLYDMYAPLIDDNEKTYTYEEAQDLIIKSLSVLGDEYISNIKRAFKENWIDVYPNDNKKSGAYSWGCYLSNPFILTNFLGRYDDVSTLAHELGHSMHNLYSHANNPYQYSGYAIFVAEVASTVNELLLAHYMINNSNDNKEKLNLLNELLELYKGTMFRQTMFAEFETEIHNEVSNGEILTYDKLNSIYYNLNKKYFGNNVIIDDEIKYEWSRIPHFYTNFYVYQYATGLASATYIVESILSGKEHAVENYLEFLKTGGRDYPVEELKIAGVDINNPQVIESAVKTFDETIDEFEKIYTK